MPIDLKKSVLLEASPRRYWERIELRPDEGIRVDPGEMVLGRTYEAISMPGSHAGKITGRSSYARMGIDTSCSCDLINPGWNGHVPLEIINNSKNAIIVRPLLPLVQVFLLPLSSTPPTDYSDQARFKSKYANDDGGPTYWWRDDLVDKLYESFFSKGVDEAVVRRLVEEARTLDEEGIYRLDRFLSSYRHARVTNAADVLADFRQSEARARRWHSVKKWVPTFFTAVALPTSAAIALSPSPIQWPHWLLFAATMVSGAFSAYFWWTSGGKDPVFYDQQR